MNAVPFLDCRTFVHFIPLSLSRQVSPAATLPAFLCAANNALVHERGDCRVFLSSSELRKYKRPRSPPQVAKLKFAQPHSIAVAPPFVELLAEAPTAEWPDPLPSLTAELQQPQQPRSSVVRDENEADIHHRTCGSSTNANADAEFSLRTQRRILVDTFSACNRWEFG